MQITYIVVPAHTLPEGVHAEFLQYETEVVIRMDDRYATPLMAEALTEGVNEHADQSWIHCASFGWENLLRTG